MHCSECGKEIAAETRFCVHCGTRQNVGEPTIAAQPPPEVRPAQTAEPIPKVDLDQPPTPASATPYLRCPKCGASAPRFGKRLVMSPVTGLLGLVALGFLVGGVVFAIAQFGKSYIDVGNIEGGAGAAFFGLLLGWVLWASRKGFWQCQSCGYDWLDQGSFDGVKSA